MAEPPARIGPGENDLLFLLGNPALLDQFTGVVFHIILIGADHIKPDLVLRFGNQFKPIRRQAQGIASSGTIRKGQATLIVDKVRIVILCPVLSFYKVVIKLIQIFGGKQSQHSGLKIRPGGNRAVPHIKCARISLYLHRRVLRAAKAIGIQGKLVIGSLGLPIEGLLFRSQKIGHIAVHLLHQFQRSGCSRIFLRRTGLAFRRNLRLRVALLDLGGVVTGCATGDSQRRQNTSEQNGKFSHAKHLFFHIHRWIHSGAKSPVLFFTVPRPARTDKA